jgi:hypothetical protein
MRRALALLAALVVALAVTTAAAPTVRNSTVGDGGGYACSYGGQSFSAFGYYNPSGGEAAVSINVPIVPGGSYNVDSPKYWYWCDSTGHWAAYYNSCLNAPQPCTNVLYDPGWAGFDSTYRASNLYFITKAYNQWPYYLMTFCWPVGCQYA